MDDLEKLQDEVLRGIGRNVLNLQKMEGMLKALVMSVQSNIALESEEQVMKTIKKRRKAVSKMPFGRLVDDFVRSMHVNDGRIEELSAQTKVATMSVSVKFDDGELVDELKASLRQVVKERNNLIHKKLAPFDPNSPEACRKMAEELEEQRQRMRPQFEALAAIWVAMRKHQQEVLSYVNSAEFDEEHRKATDEQSKKRH